MLKVSPTVPFVSLWKRFVESRGQTDGVEADGYYARYLEQPAPDGRTGQFSAV